MSNNNGARLEKPSQGGTVSKKLTAYGLFTQLINIVGFLALVTLIAMMMLTTSDVFLRYFFDRPILGSIELVELFMVSIAGLSLAWCTLRSGHIRVDLLLGLFSKKTNRSLDIINYIFTATICGLMVPSLIWRYFEGVRMDARTYVLGIPEGPFVLLLGFGYLLMFTVLIIHVVKAISGGSK
jgi:TRAP-type C4-dicarboxylate transport system permease small subunit